MPNRCGCSDSCSCLIVAGTGVTVDGIGTIERPYEISSESAELNTRLVFTDDGNVDFDVEGVGTIEAPLIVSADVALKMTDLVDVNDPTGAPADGEVPVWIGSHWEFRTPTGGGGGTGLPAGGTTGQVLAKASNLDGDATWQSITAGADEVLVATALPPTPGGLELWVDTDDTAPVPGTQLIQSGQVLITPNAANVPTGKAVVFATPFANPPNVVISTNTTVPGTTVLGAGAAAITTTGFTAYLTRINTTPTSADWIAVGTVA